MSLFFAHNEIAIKEEDQKTGGHYQARTVGENIPASAGWHDFAPVSWPHPVSLLSAETYCRADVDKDEIKVQIAPDSITGTITADVAASDTVISVSQTVIDNIRVGAGIKLDDGTSVNDLGRVLAFDPVAMTLAMETGASNAFAASTPTCVKMTVSMTLAVELTAGHRMVFGESKIGASYLPANTPIQIRYNNKDGAPNKRFVVHFEYMY